MGLPELLILGQVELEDHFEVTVRYRRDKVPCPRCGSVMVKKHESEFQRKKDRKLRDKTVEGKPQASRVIGLDEFSVKKRIFDTTISDLKERQLLGIVEGCGKTNLEKYFTALPEPEIVEVVVMDMHEPFRQAVHMCLPREKYRGGQVPCDSQC
jgi:transposase